MRVVIAEDDALLREGLVLLLANEGIEVVAAVDNADDLLSALAAQEPDLGIVDVRLPPTFGPEGLRAAVEARRRQPGLPILVLSARVEAAWAAELLAGGAESVGYLLKERVGKVADFLDAVERVVAGGVVLDPEVVSQLLVRRRTGRPLDTLTKREREVLALMAEGHDNASIADLLYIGDTAVSKHIGNIFAKLGLSPDDAGHRRVLAVLSYLRG